MTQMPSTSSTSTPLPNEEPPLPVGNLTAEVLAGLRARAEGDLYFFAKGVLGLDKLTPRIHRPLCRLLELAYVALRGKPFDECGLLAPWSEYVSVLRDALRRQNVPREEWSRRIAHTKMHGIQYLAILIPRGWFKTTLASIAFPLWCGVKHTQLRFLLAQNTFSNACAKGRALAQHVEGGELLRALFPEVLPDSKCRWSDEGRTLRRSAAWAESTFEFAGTQTQVTSRHFDVVIEDDTVAPAKDKLSEDNVLPSQVDVAQAIGWHRLVSPLQNDPKTFVNVVVGTRWFELDLLRWVMDNEKHFFVYRRACREDGRGESATEGAVTFPERFGAEELERLAVSCGPYLFSCLYMNNPMSSSEMLFRADQFHYYDEPPPLARLMTFTTVDLANDPADCKGPPDYNVVLTCGKHLTTGEVFVLDYFRKRCAPSEVIEAIIYHVRTYKSIAVGIETTGYQRSIKPWLRERQRQTKTYFAVTDLSHTTKSKVRRIQGLQPYVASGQLAVAPWMGVLVSELCMCTPTASLGVNDDVADALASQVEMWRVTPSVEEARVRDHAPDVSSYEYLEMEMERARAAYREKEAAKVGPMNVPIGWGAMVEYRVFDGN